MQYDSISSKIKTLYESSYNEDNNDIEKMKRKDHKKKSLAHKIKTKLFILVFAFANINNWRGVWYLTGYFTSDSMTGAITIGLISLLSLIAMKRVCVLISVPFILNKDSKLAAYQLHANAFNSNDYLNLDENLNVNFCVYQILMIKIQHIKIPKK